LTRDDPTFRSLEMGYALTEMELKAIYDSIKENTELGYITWHKDQIKDQIRYSILVNIENRLIENNKNYRYYPNDFTHALLSKHAYVTSTKGSSISLDPKVDMHLKNWKVVEVFDDTQKSGYYGAIYINDKTHQVVLANRGTEEIIKGLFNRNGDWKTNFEEILGGQIIVGQQAKNLRATAAAIEIAKEKGYRLSFTGHSLGGWLAELSAYYSFAYFDYRNVKAVTFDSPGKAPMMEQLQSNIRSRDAHIKLENIDIVTYLANPNPANSCNPHVGRVYRVQPKMKLTEKVESHLPNIVKNTFGDRIKAWLSVEGHLMAGILETFDPKTGKPRECKKMLDWPRVEYLGDESFSSEGKKIVKEVIGKSSLSAVTQMGLNMAMDHLIGGRTLMTIVGFLGVYIKGGIDAEQYWAYFRHIDLENESKDRGEERTELSFDNRFALFTLGKYREGKDTHRMKLNTGSVDKYLYKLYGFKEKLRANEDLPFIVKVQLDELLKSFKIVRNGKDYVLIPNPGYDVEGIVEKTQRLLDVIPNDVRTVWKNVVISKTTTNLNGEIAEEGKIKKLPDNLSSLTLHYIGIRDKEKELTRKLDKESVVVISGPGGMGKSTLATKQGSDCKQKSWQVRWFKGMQIDKEFLQLARELKIASNNLSPNEVRDLVYQELEKMGKEKPVLLIFDNVEDAKKMRKYLVNRPACTKILITSRDGHLLKEITSIQMMGFDKEQATAYVKEGLGKSKDEAERLVEVVGLSPFRLSTAVAYLSSNDLMSINEYTKYYAAIKKGHNQNRDIYPEVEMLFGDLKQNAPESWQLLQYMAYLDAEGVPLEFITQVMGITIEELQKHVNELKRLSLMSVLSEGEAITLKVSHRIVQEETKQALMEEDATKIKGVLEKLLRGLNNIFENELDKSHRHQNFKIKSELVTHAKTLIDEAKMADLLTEEHAMLIYALGSYNNDIVLDRKEALHYWSELLNNQKLTNKVNSNVLFKARLLDDMSKAHVRLGGKENIQKGVQLYKDSLEIQHPGDDEAIGLALMKIGMDYSKLEEEDNRQMSLDCYQEALKSFHMLPYLDCINIEEVLMRLGAPLLQKDKARNKLEAKEIRTGLKYLEEALNWNYKNAHRNEHRTAELLSCIGWAYGMLGDQSKFLEYEKQAYRIYFDIGSYEEREEREAKILELQPNYKLYKWYESVWIPTTYRYIIISRGETNDNLIRIKQKIQKNVLDKIVKAVDNYGWSTINFLGEWGIKGYLEEDLIKKELGDLSNDKNVEIALMLCFESMILGIMKSEKGLFIEQGKLVKSFVQENPRLIKEIASEHPEFFVDGRIVGECVEALPTDKRFGMYILKHVQYKDKEEHIKFLKGLYPKTKAFSSYYTHHYENYDSYAIFLLRILIRLNYM